MPPLKRMMRLCRSAERLCRRLRDPSSSWELYARLCAQHHQMQRRLDALAAAPALTRTAPGRAAAPTRAATPRRGGR